MLCSFLGSCCGDVSFVLPSSTLQCVDMEATKGFLNRPKGNGTPIRFGGRVQEKGDSLRYGYIKFRVKGRIFSGEPCP